MMNAPGLGDGDPRPFMPEHLASTNYQRTREMTIDELLLENRVIFLIGDINYSSAARVIMQMLYLENQKRGQDINFYINSPGGSVTEGMAIYDAMLAIEAPVSTVCMGMAMSMGSFLLAAGEPGRRFAWPHARIMIHQPLIMGTVTGTATDLDIRAKETIRLRGELNELYAKHTGQDVEKVANDTDRDFFMSAQEAKEYGLLDDVIMTTAPAPNGQVKK